MRIKLLFRVITTSLIFASLIGCQSSNLKYTNTSQIEIEGQGLSRISDKAKVALVIRSGDQILEAVEFSGLSQLPFRFTPKTNINDVTAEVTVSFSGATVLTGKQQLVANQLNTVVLRSSEAKETEETYWKAVDIAGRGIPPDVSTTIALRNQGRITGFAGCNQYRGNYRTLSSFMVVESIETTSNICANPVMYHENRYFKFLKSVEIFKEENGQLMLYTAESDQPIVYKSIDKQEILLSLKKLSASK